MAPPPRTFADARRWSAEGTKVFAAAVSSLTEADFDAATLLPGWTRRHLVAHVAANAEALGNLAHWADTGEVTPMYASPADRAEGIERGAGMSGAALTDWLLGSADQLETVLAGLSEQRWATEVRTAQGRTVPASEIPWLRAREVCVHAVDLNRGVSFADLPADFLAALVGDITAKRGDVPGVDGPLPELAAWLAGRPHALADAPPLGPWL